MLDKNTARVRRARKTRLKISELKAVRLTVHRTNCHLYAQIISDSGDKVLANPGAELADEGVVVELATQMKEGNQIGRRQSRKGTACGHTGIFPVRSQDVEGKRSPVKTPDLGYAEGSVNCHAV